MTLAIHTTAKKGDRFLRTKDRTMALFISRILTLTSTQGHMSTSTITRVNIPKPSRRRLPIITPSSNPREILIITTTSTPKIRHLLHHHQWVRLITTSRISQPRAIHNSNTNNSIRSNNSSIHHIDPSTSNSSRDRPQVRITSNIRKGLHHRLNTRPTIRTRVTVAWAEDCWVTWAACSVEMAQAAVVERVVWELWAANLATQ